MAEFTNDIIMEEAVNVTEDVLMEVPNKLGTGKIALIAASVVGVGFALYKLGKKAVDKYKAKKAIETERHEGVGENVIDVDFEE